METLVAIIQALAWPLPVLTLGFTFRGTVKRLISRMTTAKYGDVEVSFDGRMAQVEADLPTEMVDSDDHQESDDTPAFRDPTALVYEAWAQLERSAVSKIQEVLPEFAASSLSRSDPVAYFAHFSQALPPSAARAANQLHRLRNEIVYDPDLRPSSEEAIRFVSAADRVRDEIDRVESVALFSVTSITYILFQFNILLDTGKYDSITPDDVKDHIRQRDVLQYISQQARADADFSLVLTDRPAFPAFIHYYNAQLIDILEQYDGRERRKWGVENRGLCLLVAWTTEIIQRGHGWQPDASVPSA